MKRLYLSTICRGEDLEKASHGFLYLIDWEKKEVLSKVDMFPQPCSASNRNPRGGPRGWRGICAADAWVAAANNDSVVLFSSDLRYVLGIITHPLFSNIHELCYRDEKIYLANTGTDSLGSISGGHSTVVPFMEEDKTWSLVEQWVKERGRERFIPDIDTDYRFDYRDDVLHLNTISVSPDGKLYLVLNSLHMIVQYSPFLKIVYAPPIKQVHTGADIKNPHQLCFISETDAITCSSMDSSLHRVNVDTGQHSLLYKADGISDSGVDFIKYGWLRGLDYGDEHLFVGSGQATITEVDPISGHKVDDYVVSPGSVESPFSVFLHPFDWKKI